MFIPFEHDLLKYSLVISLLSLIIVNKQQLCLSHTLVKASWDDSNNDGKLLHLTINENTGQIYVGAVNKIYQLSPDLKLEAQVTMGPSPDDVRCPASRNCPQVEKKVTDYYNKALVVFEPSQYQNNYNLASFLVSCGTLFQGACALHTLTNITQYYTPANEPLVANSPNASTVVFIAPGPTEQHQSRQLPVLYIASSYTGLGPYNEEVPAISSRSLSTDSMFALAANNVASGTRLTISSLVKDRYPITYVHGFSSKGFSFFVTVQRLSTTSPKPFITKLVRICQKDTNYHSYIEVQLRCRMRSPSNITEEIDFNLAQAAFVAKPGNLLAKELLVSTQDEVLFVVFAKSLDENDTFNMPSQQSALCIYPLKTVHTAFTTNIQQCFNGNGQQGLDYVSSTVACEKSMWPITEDFCGTDMNNLINGIFPIEASPVISYNDVALTSIAVEASNDFTIAYLGTSNGRLKRISIESDRTALQYMDAPVDLTSNSPINPDMRFDKNDGSGSFLYLMNEKKVFLVKTHDCSIFKIGFDCLNEKDPYCGWCSVENKCSIKNSCAQAQQDSEYWLSYKNQIASDYSTKTSGFNFVSPSISSVSPSKGPISGGTKLLIFGTYLSSSPKVEVYVGSYPCTVTNQNPTHIDCITSPATRAGGQAVAIRFDTVDLTFPDYHFLYVDDPEIESVTSAFNLNAPLTKNSIQALPPRGIPAGGIKLHVKGKNLNCVQDPIFYVVLEGVKYKSFCQKESETELSCISPRIPEDKLLPFRIAEEPVELDYGFIMDNVKSVHNLATRGDKFPMFLMYSNPEYKPFPEEVKFYKSDYLTINGSNLDRASSEYDVKVSIGDSSCNVTSLSRNQLTCKPPPSQPAALVMNGQYGRNQLPDVVVTVGDSLNFTIGKISYDNSGSLHNLLSKPMLYVLIVGAVFLLFLVIAIMVAYEKKRNENNRVVQTMQEQMDVLEMKVASEAKQAFTELQTEMTDLTDDLEHGGIPYLDYRIYAMKVLFPNQSDHQVLNEMKVEPSLRVNFDKGINQFGQLIINKTFLILFIRTLESNKYFSMRDRVNVASLIMVTLQNRMEYCTDILKTLLADLIERTMENRSHPKLLLRRTESVVEKMLSSWFTFLLNKFLRECAGEPLFLLYQAIKHQVNKGPVDAITSEARCSLSEEKLIRQSVDYKSITLNFSINAQTAYLSGVDPNIQSETIEISVKVLDCDTISQVKDKAIDALYKSTPYSQRPHRDSFDLEWRSNQSLKVNMSDEDHTTKTEGYWRKLNTLAHYRVPDGASMTLIAKQNSIYNLPMLGNNVKNHYETLNFNFIKSNSPLNSPLNEMNKGCKYWHLVRHHDNDYRDGERSAKMVSEIYLTRLLATKGTLQRFVDDLFETIFSTARLTSSLPIAIKYMFDFLDDQAREHGIVDPEVVHTWKSNSLPLRFWVNIIKNPDFVFDIDKSNIVDSCLSVVAQTFMDACSTSEHRLGKDSPSSKLLYAKDLPIYKDWVERYYNEIAMMPPINEHDMNAMLAEESRQHAHEFNTIFSLHELYKYAVKYQDQLFQTLDNDEFANKFMLSAKLRQTILLIDGCDSNLYAP